MNDRLELGRRIAKLRCKKGLLQKDLAELIGVPLKEIAQIELGRTDLNIDTFSKIADALGCESDLKEKEHQRTITEGSGCYLLKFDGGEDGSPISRRCQSMEDGIWKNY